ncbi:MAG: TRAP transporter large permease [Betaproteobacteria bacterium]|nr:MAG: TRAP transporter large permease [Betaproteobacteria bacterium]
MSYAMLLTMILCFALTISVAVSIGLASIVGIKLSNANMLISVKEMFSAINKFPLAAIPFFILAGNIMETGGISRRLVDFAKSIVGGVQGGLPMTCVLTCMIFAAVSGSSVATTFAIGAILIPALIKHNYPREWAAALQATSAELGVIIPPSIPMILYGVSAEVSIGELFIAGFGPGLLIGGALMLYVYITCKRKGWGKNDGDGRLSFTSALLDMAVIAIGVGLLLVGNKVIGPMLVGGDASEGRHDRLTDLFGIGLFAAYFIALSLIPKVRAALHGRAAYALMMPVIILGGIYGGVFTPTEASAVAVIYALFVGMVVYGEIKLTDLAPIFKKSVVSSSVIMFIIANAGLFAFLITRAGVPDAIGQFLKEVLQNPMLFLLGVNAALFLIGMFIETSAAIIVLAPILAPVAVYFGIDPVHFGIIMVVNLALGMITPPFGVNLFAACTVARISLDRIVTRLVPFVLVVLACLMIITYVPAISLGLRDLVYAK